MSIIKAQKICKKWLLRKKINQISKLSIISKIKIINIFFSK